MTRAVAGPARRERAPRPVRRRAGGRRADALILAGYALAAVAVLKNLWASPSGRYLVDGGPDQNQWEWFFAVTARAVTRLENPLFTTLQNHPDGVNLMGNTVMLGVSVPLAPLTLACGPGATWAVVLTSGLAGTAAGWYRLVRRHLGGSRPAAAVGGAFCGFAPPIVTHANAHPNFVALFVLPFLVGRLVMLARGGRPLRDGAVLGLLAAYQIHMGEEALLLAATALVPFAAVYAVSRPDAARAAARPLLAGLAVALAVSAPLSAYPLWWQFAGPRSYDGLLHGPSGNDVAVLAAFARQSLAGHPAPPGPLDVSTTEQNAFFGWTVVVLVAVLLVWLRRLPLARALGAVVVTGVLLSLGPEIVVNGEPTGVPGPWRWTARLPLYESVLESRLTMTCVPAIGLLVALGVDRLRARAPAEGPRLCAVVLALALVPVVPKPLPAEPRRKVPAFFTDGTWRRHVSPGRALVPVPLPGAGDAEPLHWQVRSGLGFPVPEGYFVGPFGPRREGGYGAEPRPTSRLLRRAADDGPPPVGDAERAAARADLAYWRADAVVLGPHPRGEHLRATVEALLGPGVREGGVWVWRVRP
ncbi:hypothetical protein ACFQU9_21755 [Actinomadura namibiensis]|uniref:Glycosyl transferase n=1 Tax=Actinomadura namibiensis TaxID=182080 RepID=A0A7W3QMF4_ACTNM|nr:glycosyl transferase [Actinomadura namibiensis]MBA8952451.1 hypothetical protein [Actinomadura namibiensis]